MHELVTTDLVCLGGRGYFLHLFKHFDVGIGYLGHIQKHLLALLLLRELVLLVPVVNVVHLQALFGQALEQYTRQLEVVRSLIEFVGEDLFQERQQGFGFFRLAKHCWSQLVLQLLNAFERGYRADSD